MALLPPPTQATSESGRRPSCARICSRASRPMTDWKSRTMSGIRVRADGRAEQVVGVPPTLRHPVADRLVDRVLERAAPGARPAPRSRPRSRMRKTLSACRRMSSSPM